VICVCIYLDTVRQARVLSGLSASRDHATARA
jgi:hypothetical protein